MARKVIVTAALTGNFHGKEAHPNLPEQPAEIAQAAYECYNAGAAIVHLHARDKNGKATNDPQIFSEINTLVRAKSPVIIQDSTASAPHEGMRVEEGIQLLTEGEVLPEMCSLDCTLISVKWRNLNLIHDWTRDYLLKTAQLMLDKNIKPELEIFSPTSIEDVYNVLQPAGVLTDPISLSFVMGMNNISQGAMEFSIENLIYSIQKTRPGTLFSALAIGQNQLPGTIAALLMGGNVRVGFEDNLYLRQGELAKSNAQLVERIVERIREFGFDVATPNEAREILGIPLLETI